MYNTILNAYKSGVYTLDNVKLMVEVGLITSEEFKQIAGQDYIV
jgi:hypothetical protein